MVAFGGEAILVPRGFANGLPKEREFRPSLDGLRWQSERWEYYSGP
jgi:hypothetical protein